MTTFAVRRPTVPVQKVKPRSAFALLIALAVFVLGSIEHAIVFQRQPTNSDEVLATLMGRADLHGHWSLFLWGQDYGGAVEGFLVGLVTHVFGTSLLAQRSLTLIWSAVACLLLWRIGRRLYSNEAAILAASFLWTWPLFFVKWETHEYLYSEPLIVLGLAAVLAAANARDNPELKRFPLICGLLSGLGWWTDPEYLIFGLPILVLLLARREHRGRTVLLSAAGFIITAFPWIVFNLDHSFSSLKVGKLAAGADYFGRLTNFFNLGVPVMSGFMNDAGNWVIPHRHVAPIFLRTLALVLSIGVILIWRRRRNAGSAMFPPIDAMGLLVYPFIYALSGAVGGPHAFTPRYLFFGWPFAALFLGRLFSWKRLPRALSLWAAVGIAVVGLYAASNLPKTVLPQGAVQNGDFNYKPLASALERTNQTRLFTGYWQAYVLDLAANGKVIATPELDSTIRNQQWSRDVYASSDPSWLFYDNSEKLHVFRSWLEQQHISSTTMDVGAFVVIKPATRVTPEMVPTVVVTNPAEGS